MNALIVGADKIPIFEYVGSSPFLFIDDGPLIDALEIPSRRKVTRFDVSKHHLNPLHGMNYLRARQFMAVNGAIYPFGAETLRRMDSDYVLLNALLEKPTYLDSSSLPIRKTLLGRTRGIVLARLDRAVLGDFDSFVSANLLISQFKGQVIIPDFGFYGREHHISLIRQNRLVAGEKPRAKTSARRMVPC
jgi:hypothetical protein